MHEGYLLLEEIQTSDCNLESSHLTCSFPMTAAAGFSFLILKRGVEQLLVSMDSDEEFALSGYAVCLHDYQVYHGLTKNPLSLCKGAGGKQAEADLKNPPIIPEIKGRTTFSLIIKFRYEDQTPLLDRDFQKEFRDALLSVRFAGGEMISFKSYDGKILHFFNNEEELGKRLQKSAPGWFIKDRSDLIENGNSNKMKMLLESVFIPPGNNESTTWTKPSGWLYASCIGYQLLEDPVERPGRRDDSVPHAYAEPVHSVLELVHAKRLLRLSTTEKTLSSWLPDNHLLWHWHYDTEARLSRLSARTV